MSPGVVQSDLPKKRVSCLLKLGIHEATILHEPSRWKTQGGPLSWQNSRTNGLDDIVSIALLAKDHVPAQDATGGDINDRQQPRSLDQDAVLAAGVVVRDQRAAPQLGDALRITVGSPEQNDRVLSALNANVAVAGAATGSLAVLYNSNPLVGL